MTISTLDGVLAGFLPPQPLLKSAGTPEGIGIPHSMFYATGNPSAAAAPTPGINGAALTSYAGQIPFTNPTGGNLSYLARVAATCTQAGTLLICDRLWHNSGISVTTTTAQSITFPGLPARDRNGATSGVGVQLAIEVSAATTNAGAVTNMTASYTNSAGTSGQTATIPTTRAGGGFPATSAAGTFIPFDLAAGDVGVQSVQSITLGTSLATGTVHLVCYRLIASVPINLANAGEVFDAIRLGFPRMYDNSVPFLVFIPTAASSFTVQGDLTVSQG